MRESLQVLLDGIFDYAGLFPPASLDLAASLKEYCALRDSEHSWLVSRYVCPVGKLSALAALLRQVDEPIQVSVIGSGPNAIEEDLEIMSEFVHEAGAEAEIEAYELRVSGEAPLYAIKKLANSELSMVFVELDWSPEQMDQIHELADNDSICVKARTGGLASLPSSADLAGFIQECLHLDLGFKLTAGLHHLVRGVYGGEEMHGLLNVLVAGALSDANDLSRAEMERILDERTLTAFRFESDTVGWGDWDADIESIEEFRDLFISVGSCSVSEPAAELSAAGLLTEEARR